jgi:hypothetical protein
MSDPLTPEQQIIEVLKDVSASLMRYRRAISTAASG